MWSFRIGQNVGGGVKGIIIAVSRTVVAKGCRCHPSSKWGRDKRVQPPQGFPRDAFSPPGPYSAKTSYPEIIHGTVGTVRGIWTPWHSPGPNSATAGLTEILCTGSSSHGR